MTKEEKKQNYLLLEAIKIRKRFGLREALRGVSLSLYSNRCLSLLGPNGAGKSTLARVLSGISKPSSGNLVKKEGLRIGLLSHQSFLYPSLTALENLIFFARLYGIKNPETISRELISRFGLTDRSYDRVETFSRGMTQKLSIARAILNNPELLILDEPFSGLDPLACANLISHLKVIRADGTGILIISHELDLAIKIGDEIAILSKGTIIKFIADSKITKEELRTYYIEA